MNTQIQENTKSILLKPSRSETVILTQSVTPSKDPNTLLKKHYVCNHCKRPGHKIYNCRYLKREKKEKQRQQDDNKEQENLLLHKKISQHLDELAEAITHVLTSFTQFTQTIQNKMISIVSPDHKEKEMLDTLPLHQGSCSPDPITRPLKLPLSEPLDFETDAKITHIPEVNEVNHETEVNEEESNDYQQLLKLENTLEPLKIDLKCHVLFKYPQDNAHTNIDEGKDPRLILFVRDPVDFSFRSVFKELPLNSLYYNRINRWHEVLDEPFFLNTLKTMLTPTLMKEKIQG